MEPSYTVQAQVVVAWVICGAVRVNIPLTPAIDEIISTVTSEASSIGRVVGITIRNNSIAKAYLENIPSITNLTISIIFIIP